MKNVKYWYVRLYQIEKTSPPFPFGGGSGGSVGAGGGSGAFNKLLCEGYSITEVALPPRDATITLLTHPHGAESKTFRADIVDSIVCTPVYEREDEAKADSQAAKGRYNYDTFKAASKPLIQWLNENANPHASVIVDCTGAELLTGEISFNTKEFLKD
ncbi:hypothetical protein LWT56_16670 [Enterobacter roggenkampii]|uniref:hypothetical protein n=1 Tax=Enterobacter roggenkampii TaxID=1812935 RepID=UPI001E285AF0|nr:hypothetical protein [Enterobacter roggenkampii]MCE1976310.1 hypothetical protein [Enterobacter roggenkampii]